MVNSLSMVDDFKSENQIFFKIIYNYLALCEPCENFANFALKFTAKHAKFSQGSQSLIGLYKIWVALNIYNYLSNWTTRHNNRYILR